MPMTAAAAATAAGGTVRRGAAAPDDVERVAERVAEEDESPVAVLEAWATWTPNEVEVVGVPETFVVMTLVAVVEASQAFHDVQGASVLQGPAVQPDQVAAGHAVPFHQLVHAPECHDVALDHALGPQPSGPNGPSLMPTPPCELVVSGHGPPDVALKVASGDIVSVTPLFAQSVAMAA